MVDECESRSCKSDWRRLRAVVIRAARTPTAQDRRISRATSAEWAADVREQRCREERSRLRLPRWPQPHQQRSLQHLITLSESCRRSLHNEVALLHLRSAAAQPDRRPAWHSVDGAFRGGPASLAMVMSSWTTGEKRTRTALRTKRAGRLVLPYTPGFGALTASVGTLREPDGSSCPGYQRDLRRVWPRDPG